ncbi:hypothetical protein DTO164E3_5629 [Paecilomyces variotii]|nr:hypothetical protein DTO164E3_5629 [Paecilomyces variotii]KAJ9198231.1 hypothetical protein DTO032I3_5647 [Paecilomyces variotii]KAJ9274879.1 hypothetical protein DTO021D3_8237 [Paecilomyces variotii]KAJ9344681.1 hypothetical protein DTO027B6_2863 [Paecilomyces variotii]KAJ9347665.1 hypothetical protein DTO027B9_8997 [Paecilomyces variotii]
MIISPLKDQKHLMDYVLSESNVGCRNNLTVDSCQGSEANLVIYLMTRPSDHGGMSTEFLVDKQRMNIALECARKVQVIVGNLDAWNRMSINRLGEKSKNAFLMSLLRDVSAKGHTLSWYGVPTVTETDRQLSPS